MRVVEESLVVSAPVEVVFGYIGEFANAAAWDPGVRASVKLTPGPLKVGDRYRVEATFGGVPVPMDYEVLEVEAPRRVVLRGESSGSVVRDEIFFEAREGGGTALRWRLEVRFKGMASRFEPLMQPLLDRLGREAMGGIASAFEGGVPPEVARDAGRGGGVWRLVGRALDGLVAPAFARPGFEVRQRAWADPAIDVDLAGRRMVVTGANSGLGLATTEGLVARGAQVIMVCRDAGRAEAARRRVLERHPDAEVLIELADMGDLAQVVALGHRLAELGGLDGLIHNAGMLLDAPARSPQGHELTFAVHVLGPFALTAALEGALNPGARVIWVSSGGMYTQRLDVERLASGGEPFDGVVTYAQAKRAQVVLAEVWGRRLSPGVAVSAMHPGWADTPGVVTALPRFHRWTAPWLRTPEQGADTVIWLAASPEAAGASGQLYFDREVRRKHLPGARTRGDAQEAERLWTMCWRLCAPWLERESGFPSSGSLH